MTAVYSKEALGKNTTSEISDLRLKDILQKMPHEIFIRNPRKAWTSVILSILMVGLGYFGIAVSPWYLLPLFWVFTGTALTGFFVLGHDCGHRSFAKRKWVNNLVGHILFLPLLYPFHSWRILHNYHHAHTNKLEHDNAWQPLKPEIYGSLGGFGQWIYRQVRGWFWWVGSIGHWALLHFDWRQFQGKERQQVKVSVLVVLAGAAIGFPVLFATVGFWGVIKFWLMPWLGYHFWMSTFTIVHHTTLDVPFTAPEEWHEATAQLAGTVHCDYPRWVEFLCHDINVHVPHHIASCIPSYNLRAAHQIIKENWGDAVKERRFSLALMKEIAQECHLYDENSNYQSFKTYHAKQSIKL